MTTKTQHEGYDGSVFTVGDRVEIHPGFDLWMRGARFGEVIRERITAHGYQLDVNLDKSGIRRFQPDELKSA